MVGRKKFIVQFRFLALVINRQSNWWPYWRTEFFELPLIKNKTWKIGPARPILVFLIEIFCCFPFDVYQLIFLDISLIAQPNIFVIEPALAIRLETTKNLKCLSFL